LYCIGLRGKKRVGGFAALAGSSPHRKASVMKFHTGLVFAACLSLGLISYACVNGDTVNGSTGTGGNNGSGTGGNSSGNTGGSNNTGGNGSGTGGNGSSTGGNTGSGGNVSHTGGNTGTGGNGSGTGGNGSGTGGNGSGTGGSGSGTGGSIAGGNCTQGATFAPAQALITDFSDTAMGTKAGQYVFGSSAGDPGSTNVFANPMSTPGTVTITGGALTFAATLSAASGTGADEYPYNGLQIILNGPACADVSSYTGGVSFTISGSVGTCGLVFSFNDAEHTNASDDTQRGLGTGGAYAPQLDISAMVKSTAMTVMIPWSSTFTGGSPAATTSYPDKMKFTGIQFQFTQPMTATKTCMGSLTLDNIKFY
jgi:hypothetical protein